MDSSFLKKNTTINEPNSGVMYKDNVKKLLEFYKDTKSNICTIEGKTGSYKTKIFDESINNLEDNVLVFKIKCFEYTTLDDIFLNIFEQLKKFSQQNKVFFTKIEANSISQKINTYLKHINSPVVVLFDSLENIFYQENSNSKEEIFSFIEHLKTIANYKIIVLSSIIDTKYFNPENSFSIKLNPLTPTEIEKAFNSSAIACNENLAEEYYELTRGNHNYFYITLNIILTLNMTLSKFLDEFKKKHIRYEDFLLQKLITFIPQKSKSSIFKLALFEGGISSEYLINNGLFDEDDITYMLDKNILTKEYGLIFIKNNLKKYIQSLISHSDKTAIHKYWRKFYSSQLPLKPNERAIIVSRNTMRTQIEHHSKFIIEKDLDKKQLSDLSLMSYLKSNLTEWNIKNTNTSSESKIGQQEETYQVTKDKDFEKYELTKDELALLNVPVDMRTQKDNNNVIFQQLKSDNIIKSETNDNVIYNLIEKAKSAEAEHDFENAYKLYFEVLNKKSEKNYSNYLPEILKSIAFCAMKLNKTPEAIECYNKLIELSPDTNTSNEYKLEIAYIYKKTYKTNYAKVIYESFINKKGMSNDDILYKSYIELAEIEEDTSNSEKAIEYYKAAFDLKNVSQKITEKYKADSYYKYALVLDENNDTINAYGYYQKAIDTYSENSEYQSVAYSNAADILKGTGNIIKAQEYYNKALNADIKNSNFEGMYYLYLKLADIAQVTDSDAILTNLKKALKSATKLNDDLYITNAYVQIGDYYISCYNTENAFKSYLHAKANINNIDIEAQKEILHKIEKTKKLLTQETIDKIAGEIKNNG